MITPDTFKPLAPGVSWALGVIMFGMGLTLTLPDFGLIIKRPLPVLVGVVAQYLIMPLVGWSLCYMFRLPDAVAVGVILVGCAPGGTASNVISYLAKADVALSVTMTSISTLLAPLMTPLLTAWLVGSRMPGGWRGDGAEHPVDGPRSRAWRLYRSLCRGPARGEDPAAPALDLGAGYLLRAAGRVSARSTRS